MNYKKIAKIIGVVACLSICLNFYFVSNMISKQSMIDEHLRYSYSALAGSINDTIEQNIPMALKDEENAGRILGRSAAHIYECNEAIKTMSKINSNFDYDLDELTRYLFSLFGEDNPLTTENVEILNKISKVRLYSNDKDFYRGEGYYHSKVRTPMDLFIKTPQKYFDEPHQSFKDILSNVDY